MHSPSPLSRVHVLPIFIIAALFLASGCGSMSKQAQLEQAAKDWCATIRASQVMPVYPLTEDVQPGDIFLVQVPIDHRGWDGCVCDQPHLNSSCIVLEHIRDSRKDAEERKNAGQTIDQLKPIETIVATFEPLTICALPNHNPPSWNRLEVK